MPSIAITGGIACGKSTITNFLTKNIEGTSFSADEAVSQLLNHNQEVALEIEKTFGPAIYNSAHQIDRAALRSLITGNLDNKKALEAILHPRIRSQWHPQAIAAQKKSHPYFIAEIPLLYENDLAGYFDHVIVVAASPNIQLHRLITCRKISLEAARSLLHIQDPLTGKINCANTVIWNDGTTSSLSQQLKITLSFIRQLQFSLSP